MTFQPSILLVFKVEEGELEISNLLCSRHCQSDNTRSSITSQKSLQETTPSQWPREVTLKEVKERMAQWPGNKGVT